MFYRRFGRSDRSALCPSTAARRTPVTRRQAESRFRARSAFSDRIRVMGAPPDRLARGFSRPASAADVHYVLWNRVVIDGSTPTAEDGHEARRTRDTRNRNKSGIDCMAADSGAGEGQALARRLLEALDAGRRPDWDTFYGSYRYWLAHVAAGCLTKNSRLGSEFQSPEDLVNAFFVEKVFPARQARLMLGAPARGECPLRPRLAASLRNFCVDVLRSRPAIRGSAADEVDIIEAPHEIPLPDYEGVAGAIVRQLDTIRACMPLAQGARLPPSPAPSSPTGLGRGVRRSSIAADSRNREHRVDASAPRAAHSLGRRRVTNPIRREHSDPG